MFAALHLRQSFVEDARAEPQPLRVRIGINLGPVKLVKDINGALNELGVFMRITQQLDSTTGNSSVRLFLGGCSHPVDGNETLPIDGIEFTIRNPRALRDLFVDLSGYFLRIAHHEILSSATLREE